jgi:uncharacterized membrane protein (UPF0127 family)
MLYDIEINDKTLKIAVANTDQQHKKGLSGMEKLGKYKGLLFIFPEKAEYRMVMRNMNFPLDFIFIKENKVIQLGSLLNKETEYIDSKEPVDLILEVNKGIIAELNIKINDKVYFSKDLITQFKGVKQYKEGGKFEMIGDKVYRVKEDDIKIDHDKMQILNNDGVVAANIESGARIFSRQHTKEIIDLVKNKNKQELGRAIVKIYDIQNNQKQEYVTK